MKTIKYQRPNGEEIIYSVPDDAVEVREDKGVEEIVAEYRSLLGNLLDQTSFGEYVSSFHHAKVEDWLRTTLTAYGNTRYEEGVKAERERTQILLHDVIKGN